jgi:hypothetical protein
MNKKLLRADKIQTKNSSNMNKKINSNSRFWQQSFLCADFL